MSNLVPIAVPPMSPRVRELLYGVFAWASLVCTTVLSVSGTAIGFGVDVPTEIPTWAAISQAGIGSVWGFLGLVAKKNVPDTGQPLDDTDLELG